MKNKIKLVIKASFILFAFWIIFHKLNLTELKKIELKEPFWLFVAFIMFNLSQIISAKRVHTYLSNIDITPTFKHQLMLYYVGMFYNTILPGGIGGDAYKAYKFEKSFNKGYKLIIKSLLIDRVSGLFAIFILMSILLFFSSFTSFLAFGLLLLILSPFALYFIHKLFFIEFKPSFYKNLNYSIIIQSLQVLSFIFILFSFGIKEHLIDFSILFLISSVVSSIPISIGGVGLRELTFLYGLELLHLNPATGVVVAFLFFIINLISSTIGILFIKKVENLNKT
jgi:uncharacterized membrane protein YbhN (UPF0104 family)